MSELLDLQYKLQDTSAAISQLEHELAANPNSPIVRINLESVQNRFQRLEAAGRPPSSCEICETPIALGTAHWDHDHQTREFRGWLCERCNTTLGRVRDSVSLLKRFIGYLEK